MADLRLSAAAAADLEEIATYGFETFGPEQTLRYRDGLKIRLAQIAQNPLLFQAVDEIRPGYRRSVYESHAIYYRIDDHGGVLVVRILGRQDVIRHLPD